VAIQFPVKGAVMSKFECVIAASSTNLPDCRCGAEMLLAKVLPTPAGDSEIHIFRCGECDHELRLTIWHSSASAA